MTIEDKDILQMDGTIIAGSLVLLTVSSVAPGSLISQSALISIASGLVINFGLSAMGIVWKYRKELHIRWVVEALGALVFRCGYLICNQYN